MENKPTMTMKSSTNRRCRRLFPGIEAGLHEQRHPQSSYTDQHTIFQDRNQPSVEQEFSIAQPCGQFGCLVDEVGILGNPVQYFRFVHQDPDYIGFGAILKKFTIIRSNKIS